MSALFKTPSMPTPPAPIPPPPMPDFNNPAALAGAKALAAQRAGRQASVYTTANSGRTLASGAVGVPYAGATLGGGR